MPSKAFRLLALAAMLPLMGQGCVDLQSRMQLDGSTQTPAANVDASVDAELDAAADVDAQERRGDTDPDLMQNDSAELNTYTEMQYEVQ